jgi:hypothetical protein
MKKFYLFGLTFGLISAVQAQSMNENFEAWSAGSYMGVNSAAWSTWSGAVGGAEDVQVSTTLASDGTKSIYFVGSTSGGGPQDVVVDFGGEYNYGHFLFETEIYVVSGKGAYFNFQANSTVGEVWSLNCQMVQDGNLYLDDGAGNSITTTYPTATWFTLTLDINLNTNDWELLIDGVSQGVLQNSVNQLASIDIFPVNAQYGGNNLSGFYLDQFTWAYTPYVLPALNGAVTGITNLDGVAGVSTSPTVTVRNLGTNNITSFDLTIDYNGTQIVENVTAVNIVSLASYTVDFTGVIDLVAGSNPVVATISNINGFPADMDAADDIKTVNVDPVVPAPGKMVVAEEGTGTWCQWCPRGAVFMDMMTDTYGDYFVGIAVHNGDPMTVTDYDAAIGGLIGGYPSALVDRLPEIDPSVIETDFMTRVVVAPKAIITIGATYDSGTGLLKVSVSADAQQNITGNYRLAMVITEDDVTGTGAQWAQSNAYAGGGNGVMGGFELLPNPVPAAQMVYDHVARIILPDFAGQANSFPGGTLAGETRTLNFELTVDPSWDLNQIHIIGLLIDPTGKIDNAGTATKAEAEANGFIDVSGISETVVGTPMNMYPNPANEMTTIALGNIENEMVNIRIVDLQGRVAAEKNYGALTGDINLPIATNLMEPGIYMVQVTVGAVVRTSRLVVQ